MIDFMTRLDYISSRTGLASAAHILYFHDKMPLIGTLGSKKMYFTSYLTTFSTFLQD